MHCCSLRERSLAVHPSLKVKLLGEPVPPTTHLARKKSFEKSQKEGMNNDITNQSLENNTTPQLKVKLLREILRLGRLGSCKVAASMLQGILIEFKF